MKLALRKLTRKKFTRFTNFEIVKLTLTWGIGEFCKAKTKQKNTREVFLRNSSFLSSIIQRYTIIMGVVSTF